VELRELRSLAALSELKSISLVAEQLHLSPAAVHKQLKTMSAELGVKLYDRVGRGLHLSQAAEVLLPYLKDLLAQYDSALTALDEWKGMRRGLVRIGAGPTLSGYVLPPILQRYRKAHPDVELLVQTGNTPVLLEGLSKGALDLALLVSNDLTEGNEYSVAAHWDFELVLVSHVRQPQRNVRLAALKHARFILFPKGSRMEQPIDRYFAARQFEPNVIMRFDNAEAIKAMIRTGLGISMLPMWVVDQDLRRRSLALIHQKEEALFSKIALIRRRSAYTPKSVQAFIEIAQKMQWRNPRLTASPHAASR
jgi:DNA-binding transcriptional LysR family regulator